MFKPTTICGCGLLLLIALATVSARSLSQIQICDANIKPGQVSISSIKVKETKNEGSYSLITIEWPHPKDRTTSAGLDSCITKYDVKVSRADNGQVFQNALVDVSPAHTTASYTAKGLTPGGQYKFAVTPQGSTGIQGSTGMPAGPFTAAAGAPAPPACRQPNPVSNIRKTGGVANGATASMTIAWDPSSTPKDCLKEYVITVYPAGSTSAIKTTSVPGTSTTFTDTGYTSGKSYEFYIYGRNPAIGASGNGQGLKSPPLLAPSGITPL